jgi:hypothetical protein
LPVFEKITSSMPLLSALVALSLCDCYSVTGSPRSEDFVIAPGTCFVFRNAMFEDSVNVTISLALVSNNTFFGTDTAAGIPPHIVITHEDLPSSLSFDYDEFKKPIPIFCNPQVDASYRDNVEVPSDLKTHDKKAVIFELSFVQNHDFYTEHFGANGNCLLLTRDIPQLDVSDISAGECFGIVFGLVGGAIGIALAIVFVTPCLQGRGREDGAEDEHRARQELEDIE